MNIVAPAIRIVVVVAVVVYWDYITTHLNTFPTYIL